MSVLLVATFGLGLSTVTPKTTQKPNFEIVVPWERTHERTKIIASMFGNNTALNAKYNFTYTHVGGSPSDRADLTKRFLAGDYPNMIICTQDWYTEFYSYGSDIWHDFSTEIAAWSGDRAGWRTDIPTGWWSILDKDKGDGTGDNIFALPVWSQSVLPYINLNDFADAGLTAADVDTIDDLFVAAEKLEDAGHVPFAMVGKLQSDLVYMNYMMGSTNNYINSSENPATVFSWDDEDLYGLNGSLSVEGFAAYMKLKGEGYVQETVDTDGGGEVNNIFGDGLASIAFCGPWGTSIFMDRGLGADEFKAIPMFKTSDGQRSTITGGGMSMVPTPGFTTEEINDAATLAQWLLEEENQMKTVSNWLDVSWRFPVRTSVTDNEWFTASGHPERANFKVHTESLSYAYPWGRQHPDWLTAHSSVLMPGYLDALLKVERGKGYTDAWYMEQAQCALDKMAAQIQANYLGGPYVTVTCGGEGGATPGFEIIHVLLMIGLLGAIQVFRKRK